jgi:hypothetical protein
MPTQTLQISGGLNVSIQEGDTVYAAKIVGGQSGTNHPGSGSTNTKPIAIGKVTSVNQNGGSITINTYPAINSFSGNSYIMFSKDNRVNTSGIVGYFAECELKNYSTKAAEIFVVATDYVESSK